MSERWARVRLADVLIQNGDYIQAPEPRLYPKLSVKLYGKGVVLDAPADGALLRMKRHQLASPGQVILSEIWGKKGAIGLVPAAGKGALCTSHFFLFDVRTERVERAWLHALFQANYLQDQLAGEARGTTGYAAVRPKTLLACEIPLPPLAEQRRILARIDELATHLAEARRLREAAVEQRTRLIRRSAATVFEAASELFTVVPLGSRVEMRGGGTPSKSDPSFWGGEIPWVTPKDMKSREIHSALDKITAAGAAHSAAKPIEPGAVLVVVRGMILNHTVPSAVLRVAAAINQDMKALIPRDDLSPEFLCEFLWAFNERILGRVEKSTHDTRKLATSVLLDVGVPVPPVEEQRRIAHEMALLRYRLQGLGQFQFETAAELDALLPSILDHAFKGEL